MLQKSISHIAMLHLLVWWSQIMYAINVDYVTPDKIGRVTLSRKQIPPTSK